jgi:xanthine dehydrogenase small subunit
MRDSVTFYLNGIKKTVSGDHLFLPLSSYLRYENQLTGTKVVCAEGDCGACTVMAAKWKPESAPKTTSSPYIGINSCIAMTFAMDGANLVTVEGLKENNELSEVQCSMVRNFGGQCGFCTPGFVMAIANMHEHKKNPTAQNAKNYLTGNLCRCTGYQPIIDAALDVEVVKHKTLKERYPVKAAPNMTEGILVKSKFAEYCGPTTIEEACRYKSENPDCVIFSGSTDLGVQFNKGHIRPKKYLSLHLIPQLYSAAVTNEEVTVGARVTLSELQKLIEKQVPNLDRFLNIFASPQIKNSATLVGNLANASPIADTTPAMMALDAEVQVQGLSGKKSIPLKDFYIGYKKLKLQQDEIITAVKFKVPPADHIFENYKVSQRRDLDISTVNASFNFKVENKKVQSARISLGGVGATTLRMTDIESKLTGSSINSQWVKDTKKLLMDSVKPLTDHRGQADYRKILVGNLFEKFANENLQGGN